MLKLLQILIFGHVHKWKPISQSGYVDYDGEVGKAPVLARGTQYTLRCERCGEMKVFKE